MARSGRDLPSADSRDWPIRQPQLLPSGHCRGGSLSGGAVRGSGRRNKREEQHQELLGLRSAAGGRKKTVLSKAPERWFVPFFGPQSPSFLLYYVPEAKLKLSCL